MNTQPTTQTPQKISITVALDASPESLAALELSSALAKWMKAEICGVFVEDDDLLRLCELPFSTEIGAQSATPRYLTEFCISREFDVLERAMQQRLEETANRYEIPWRFEVRKGPVTEQLLSAAKETTIFSIGRVGRSAKRQQIGSSTRRLMQEASSSVLISSQTREQVTTPITTSTTVTVLYTGTPAADRALRQATQLVQNSESTLTVIVWQAEQNTMAATADELAQSVRDQVPAEISNSSPITLQKIEGHRVTDLLRFAWSVDKGMLILPAASREKLSAWLDMIEIPVLLVP